MNHERRAEIREHAAFASTYAEYQRVAGVYVPELLAEVDRLNQRVAELIERVGETKGQSHERLLRVAELEAERDRARATARRIWRGETHPDGEPNWLTADDRSRDGHAGLQDTDTTTSEGN